MANIDSENRLACAENCPFVQDGMTRPCSRQVFDSNQVCIKNIQAEPKLQEFGHVTVSASMNDLMNRSVEVKKGFKKVAIVSGGSVMKQNIAGY